MTGSVRDRLDAEWRVLARRPVPDGWLAPGGGLAEALGAVAAGTTAPPVPVLGGRVVGVRVGRAGDERAAAMRRHPAGLLRLGAVVDRCRDRSDPATGNRVLGSVLGLAGGGDEMAARLALQALLPVVASTAAGMAGYVGRWGPWESRADLDGEAAATMAELVRSPLPDGTAWPAAVLRSRLRDRLRVVVQRHRRTRDREPALGDDDRHPATDLDEAHSLVERMARLVVDATHGGHISRAAAQTVLVTTVYGWDTASLARLTGRDVRAVRTHRRRTERRLGALLVA
jgi:DNA-directed RNA polymerase specialized sigma24 family protein